MTLAFLVSQRLAHLDYLDEVIATLSTQRGTSRGPRVVIAFDGRSWRTPASARGEGQLRRLKKRLGVVRSADLLFARAPLSSTHLYRALIGHSE